MESLPKVKIVILLLNNYFLFLGNIEKHTGKSSMCFFNFHICAYLFLLINHA